MHGVEKIFSLRIDTDAQFFTFAAQALLQVRSALPRAGAVSDDNHGKLPLHHCLVDINNAAAGFRQYLSNSSNNTRMIYAKH